MKPSAAKSSQVQPCPPKPARIHPRPPEPTRAKFTWSITNPTNSTQDQKDFTKSLTRVHKSPIRVNSIQTRVHPRSPKSTKAYTGVAKSPIVFSKSSLDSHTQPKSARVSQRPSKFTLVHMSPYVTSHKYVDRFGLGWKNCSRNLCRFLCYHLEVVKIIAQSQKNMTSFWHNMHPGKFVPYIEWSN